jgi:hypothetical protein
VIPGPAPERQKGARPAERTPYVPGLAATRTPVRGTAQRFVPQLFGAHVTRTNALEALAISGGVRLRCYVVGATGFEPPSSSVSDPTSHYRRVQRTFKKRERWSESRS